MLNLTDRIHRLFNWIKRSQHHSNNQLSSPTSQAQLNAVITNETIQLSEDSNVTTSFNITNDTTTNSITNTIGGRSAPTRLQMQYQPPSSLSVLPSSASGSSPVTNGARQSRRSRRSRRGRSSRTPHLSNSYSLGSSASSSFNSKRNERNILSASCAIFCIAILAVSLVEIRWFYLNGGGCNVNYVGVAHFFAPGHLEYQFETSKVTKSEITVYTYILSNGLVLKNCANREIMLIMRTVIAFVFLAIFSSSIGLMLDSFGCMKSGVKLIRRHGIFHILTVVFCLIINGFCFWISEKMSEQQNETRLKKGKKIEVSFDVSYYLIVLASGLSILATAFTLIRRYPTDEDEQLERLLEEYTGFEEPVHLERSLPAISHTCNSNQSNFFLLNNLLNSSSLTHTSANARHAYRASRSSRHLLMAPPPPPPPSTPPPSLHSSYTNPNNQQNNNEPPPPYDPTPIFA